MPDPLHCEYCGNPRTLHPSGNFYECLPCHQQRMRMIEEIVASRALLELHKSTRDGSWYVHLPNEWGDAAIDRLAAAREALHAATLHGRSYARKAQGGQG